MPKVKFFVYSSSAMHEKDGPSINLPQTCFLLEYCPTQYSFSLTVGVNGFDGDRHAEPSIRIEFVDPDNETLVNTGGIPLTSNDKVSPLNAPMAAEMGHILALNLQNVSIKKEGFYKTNVFVNDEPLGNYPIYIGRNVKNDSL